jgi:hypothetical protein
MVILTSYHHSKWTCQTLISPHPENLQNPRKEVKKNLPVEIVNEKKIALISLLILMSQWTFLSRHLWTSLFCSLPLSLSLSLSLSLYIYIYIYIIYLFIFQNCLSASFLFRFRLDSFNFESSLTKKDKNSNTSDSKGVTPEPSQYQGSKLSLTEGNAGCDDCLDMKLPACKSVGISEVEILIGDQGDLNFINDGSASKSATSENLVGSHGGGTSPRKAITMTAGETDQQKSIPENSIFAGPYAQQLKPDLPVQPVHANDPNLDTVSDVSEAKICSLGTEEKNASSGEPIDVDKVTCIVGSDHENSPRKNSPPVHITGSDSNDGERNKSGGNAPFKHMNDTEPAEPVEGDLDIKDTSTKNNSRKMAYDTKGSIENQRSTSKLPLAPLGR